MACRRQVRTECQFSHKPLRIYSYIQTALFKRKFLRVSFLATVRQRKKNSDQMNNMNFLAAAILASLWVIVLDNLELERCSIIVQYSSISLSLAVGHGLRITSPSGPWRRSLECNRRSSLRVSCTVFLWAVDLCWVLTRVSPPLIVKQIQPSCIYWLWIWKWEQRLFRV